MVTFEQLVKRAQTEIESTEEHGAPRHIVEQIVMSAITGMGLHLNSQTGEVCDPRPKPVINYPYDAVERRYRGRSRRR